jgi:hypothetical protein
MSNRGIVEEYWGGVARRLQIEVNTFNRLIEHNAEVGRENELSLVRIVEQFVPPSVGIGSGIVFDSAGNRSKQTDLIFFDRGGQPQLLAQTSQMLYPVETVLLTVEVKTTVDTAAIEDFAEKSTALQKLVPASGNKSPGFGFFGYSCALSPATAGRTFSELSEEVLPDLLCIVDPGIIGKRTRPGFEVGFVPLHEVENGQRISNKWRYSEDLENATEVIGEQTFPLFAPEPRSKERICGDPGRALLLFCEALLAHFGSVSAGTPGWFSAYLTGVARETLQII